MRLFVRYPKEVIDKPILSSLMLETKTRINVLRAHMDGRVGEMILDVIDVEKEKEAVNFLRKEGVYVKEIKIGVSLDTDKCIDCGACISICPSNALYFDEDFSLKLDDSKCILCKRCTEDCPVGALRTEFDF